MQKVANLKFVNKLKIIIIYTFLIRNLLQFFNFIFLSFFFLCGLKSVLNNKYFELFFHYYSILDFKELFNTEFINHTMLY